MKHLARPIGAPDVYRRCSGQVGDLLLLHQLKVAQCDIMSSVSGQLSSTLKLHLQQQTWTKTDVEPPADTFLTVRVDHSD